MVTVPINRKYNIGRHVGSVMNPPLRQGRRVHDRVQWTRPNKRADQWTRSGSMNRRPKQTHPKLTRYLTFFRRQDRADSSRRSSARCSACSTAPTMSSPTSPCSTPSQSDQNTTMQSSTNPHSRGQHWANQHSQSSLLAVSILVCINS